MILHIFYIPLILKNNGVASFGCSTLNKYFIIALNCVQLKHDVEIRIIVNITNIIRGTFESQTPNRNFLFLFKNILNTHLNKKIEEKYPVMILGIIRYSTMKNKNACD